MHTLQLIIFNLIGDKLVRSKVTDDNIFSIRCLACEMDMRLFLTLVWPGSFVLCGRYTFHATIFLHLKQFSFPLMIVSGYKLAPMNLKVTRWCAFCQLTIDHIYRTCFTVNRITMHPA